MANRRLTNDELEVVGRLLERIRSELAEFAGQDKELLFAARRKVAKELVYDERGKPMHRRALKLKKRQEQNGLCFHCQRLLPEAYAVLDRIDAINGYTMENTRLLCQECDTKLQRAKGDT